MDQQRRAVVTGASSDIGAAIALELAKDGYALWLTYHEAREKAEDVARLCREVGAETCLSQLDLRSLQSIQALVGDVNREWGELHVLINNAGLCSFAGYESITSDDWDTVLETNARGTFLLTRECLPLLRRAKESGADRTIINISAIAGQVGALQAGIHFAASKAAVLAITRSFARLLAKEGIRVNAVSPGPVDTSMIDHVPPERKQTLGSAVPIGRFGTAEEVAWIAFCLASPRASFATGATYDVNGGVRID